MAHEQPLLLTIRFSASLPDLELDIPRPRSTTVVALKHTIRARLSEPNSQRRLRFIHGGKILPDGAVLSSVLRAPPPPPPPPAQSRYYSGYGREKEEGAGEGDGARMVGSGPGTGKGKSVPGRPLPHHRIYVNCSIGDSLTSAELEAEAAAAAAPPASTNSGNGGANNSGKPTDKSAGARGTGGAATATTTTTPAPRGFDRLLGAGFTPAEVNQLRLQFRSIHASRYTPDTLPSPDGFRRMEDAWIDSSNNNNSTNLHSTTSLNGGGGGGGDDDGAWAGTGPGSGIAGTIDVLVRGVVVGFMWPLGSGAWLMREEGMSSGRSRFMVGVGVLFSVLIGVIRAISGER